MRGQPHPRIRGENTFLDKGILLDYASPPHSRGKREILPHERLCKRLTPAHAGKTIAGGVWSTVSAPHPRTRGENVTAHGRGAVTLASPPHSRGKIRFVVDKSKDRATHPRTCGENIIIISLFFLLFDSPPHSRGRPTPSLAYDPERSTHPRTRGENSNGRGNGLRPVASPPLARGKRIALDRYLYLDPPPHSRGKRIRPSRAWSCCRLTPALAGKTSCGKLAMTWESTHPRNRGENLLGPYRHPPITPHPRTRGEYLDSL